MKFVVPFKIPAISSMRLAERHWWSGLMIGIPPPTLASKKKFTPFSCAIFRSSAPFFATSSLFDVTTLLPARSEDFTKSYDGFIPPITSTTTEISGSFRIILKSFTNLSF